MRAEKPQILNKNHRDPAPNARRYVLDGTVNLFTLKSRPASMNPHNQFYYMAFANRMKCSNFSLSNDYINGVQKITCCDAKLSKGVIANSQQYGHFHPKVSALRHTRLHAKEGNQETAIIHIRTNQKIDCRVESQLLFVTPFWNVDNI